MLFPKRRIREEDVCAACINLRSPSFCVFSTAAWEPELQKHGLKPGQKPELAALEMPETVTAIHAAYARAGADLLLANTFGANARKLAGTGYGVDEVVAASLRCARDAAEKTGALVGLDIGPLGELLAPAGTLSLRMPMPRLPRLCVRECRQVQTLFFWRR